MTHEEILADGFTEGDPVGTGAPTGCALLLIVDDIDHPRPGWPLWLLGEVADLTIWRELVIPLAPRFVAGVLYWRALPSLRWGA